MTENTNEEEREQNSRRLFSVPHATPVVNLSMYTPLYSLHIRSFLSKTYFSDTPRVQGRQNIAFIYFSIMLLRRWVNDLSPSVGNIYRQIASF